MMALLGNRAVWAARRAEMVCLLPCSITLAVSPAGKACWETVTPLSHWGLLGAGNETWWDKWPGDVEDWDWTLHQGK